MKNAELIHYFFMFVAIFLEVAANILIKYSDGFERRWIGSLGIACILLSFTALSQAIQGIDLSIAYALWGATGIFLTTVAGRVFFQQRLNRSGYLGIGFIVLGASILKLA